MSAEPPAEQAQYDVVVVGAGIAGLTAALAAREAGARVVVVERAEAADSGGNTRYTEAFLRMQSIDDVSEDFESKLLDDFAGYPDPGVLVESLQDSCSWSPVLKTLNTLNAELVHTLAANAGPTLRWINSHGVKFEALPTPFLTTSTTRLMPVGGGLAMIETLGAAAAEHGVQFAYATTARRLLHDDAGRVVGVHAQSRGSGTRELRGRVVLACGGFEGGNEILARYLGGGAIHTRPVARGGHYNKGEGLEMALHAGAAGSGNFGAFHAEPIDPRSGSAEPAIFAFPYGILVNRAGLRFTDEAPGPVDAWYERITRRIHAQPEGIGYVIFDSTTAADVPNLAAAIRTDQPRVEANSLADLASALDLPAETLNSTVAEFNAACPNGEFRPFELDGLSTTALAQPKSNWARPIETPPYRAYPIIAANVFTFGGIKINKLAEVVDSDGEPIPGLYAAGEATGMYYTNYTGSTSVLRGAVFGRIAGTHAAGTWD